MGKFFLALPSTSSVATLESRMAELMHSRPLRDSWSCYGCSDKQLQCWEAEMEVRMEFDKVNLINDELNQKAKLEC